MADADGLYIGLMSGTSVDAIDAALVRFDNRDGRLHAECLHALAQPWDDELRQRLLMLGQGVDVYSIDELGELDHEVGAAFAVTANRVAHVRRKSSACELTSMATTSQCASTSRATGVE